MLVSENSLRALIKEEFKRDHSVEEARLLYVEFTRAKCELHVIIGENELQLDRESKIFYDAKKPIDFLTLSDCEIVKYTESELKEYLKINTPAPKIVGKLNDNMLSDEIRKNLTFVYPFNNDIYLPIKSSVSEYNHTEEYFEKTKLFGESNSKTGTAYHHFLQLSSLNKDLIDSELNEFLITSQMSKEEISMIDKTKLKSILSMDIFKIFKDYNLLKEQKFC